MPHIQPCGMSIISRKYKIKGKLSKLVRFTKYLYIRDKFRHVRLYKSFANYSIKKNGETHSS